MNPSKYDWPEPEYDPDLDAYIVDPPADADVSTLAILAVAQVAEVDPLSLRPQYYTYDPERIDELYEARTDESVTIDCDVSVRIADHRVVIESDGTLRIDAET